MCPLGLQQRTVQPEPQSGEKDRALGPLSLITSWGSETNVTVLPAPIRCLWLTRTGSGEVSRVHPAAARPPAKPLWALMVPVPFMTALLA